MAELDISTARSGVALFDQITQERARLEELCRKQGAEIEHLHREHKAEVERLRVTIDGQAGQIAVLQRRADHYMAFSTNIVTRLNVVRQVVDEAQRMATDDTYAKLDTPPPTPEKNAGIDAAGAEVARILRRVQPAAGDAPEELAEELAETRAR